MSVERKPNQKNKGIKLAIAPSMMAKNALVRRKVFGEQWLRRIGKKELLFNICCCFSVVLHVLVLLLQETLVDLQVSTRKHSLTSSFLELYLDAVQRNSLDCNAGTHVR